MTGTLAVCSPCLRGEHSACESDGPRIGCWCRVLEHSTKERGWKKPSRPRLKLARLAKEVKQWR